ncbi:hypothetical protein FACS189427_03380 [Planctomycetales bacterium]|nr:hypothetical protein FACS189427_03380 [Planctomycetales bacterium]
MLNLIPKEARLCNNTYIVNVTPDIAKAWLDSNNFNRPRNAETVAGYVRLISEGHWRLTHQGIAFTEDGILLDGQHRLFAIAESGVTVPLRVCINEPANNFTVVDCGKNRSNLDVVRMAMRDGTIKSNHTGTLKAMLAGRFCKTVNQWSNTELKDLYAAHRKAVTFAVEQFHRCKNRQINDRTVKGVIARAYYNVPQETLEHFCYQLIGNSEHVSIAGLANCLNYWRDRTVGTKQEIYRRTELTLEAFINNAADISFDKNIPELFPLPNEQR